MNVLMVLDNNQNNILPYRSRFPQMPKVEIKGIFFFFRKLKDHFWKGLHKQLKLFNIVSQLFHGSTVIFNLKTAKEKALQKSSPSPQIQVLSRP